MFQAVPYFSAEHTMDQLGCAWLLDLIPGVNLIDSRRAPKCLSAAAAPPTTLSQVTCRYTVCLPVQHTAMFVTDLHMGAHASHGRPLCRTAHFFLVCVPVPQMHTHN